MRFRDLLKLSTRTFRTRKGRTFLTILGISVGIGAILVFVSLGYGLQKIMLEQITTAESLLSLDVSVSNTEILSLDKKKIAEISEILNVEEVSPLAVLPGQATFGNLTANTLFYGVFPSYFKLGGIIPKNGQLFEKSDDKKLVLSSALLKSFNVEPSQAIGREIKITLFKIQKTETGEEKVETFEKTEFYQISGIIDDEFIDFAYLPLGALDDLRIENYSQAKVKVSQIKLIEEVRNEIINKGFFVSSLSETVDEANKIFTAIQVTLAIFGLVALFVAAIGMVNTMTVTLLERTNEIGIMKAIGAADRDIGWIFLTESILMGFLGGVGGAGLGLLFSEIFNFIINILAKRLGGQPAELFFTPLWFIVFIIVFSTLVGFLSGIMPTRKAARLKPLEALRYK